MNNPIFYLQIHTLPEKQKESTKTESQYSFEVSLDI